MIALDADEGVPPARGETFRIVIAGAPQRRAVAQDQGSHHRVGQAGEPAVGRLDPGLQPLRVIGERNDVAAVGRAPQTGEAAEGRDPRAKVNPGAEHQGAEAGAVRIGDGEAADRLCLHIDGRRAPEGLRALRQGNARAGHGRGGGTAADEKVTPCEPQATALRRGAPRAGGAAFSSNSSASFSVMTPPSSSASTMVTARR